MKYLIVALIFGFVLLVSGVFMYAGIGPAFITAGALVIGLSVLLATAT